MLINLLIHPLIVFTSLSTASGVLLHDMRLDKMAITAISGPVAAPNYDTGAPKLPNFTADAHTHTERHSLAQVVNDLKTPNPRQQPRGNEDKKHLMQTRAPKGVHAFDSYYLPL
jgi:hypothetical protein